MLTFSLFVFLFFFSCSWFAGYITKEEAKERLRNEKAGTFLVRFNASMVAPGFVLSKKSCRTDAVAEFNILVSDWWAIIIFGQVLVEI